MGPRPPHVPGLPGPRPAREGPVSAAGTGRSGPARPSTLGPRPCQQPAPGVGPPACPRPGPGSALTRTALAPGDEDRRRPGGAADDGPRSLPRLTPRAHSSPGPAAAAGSRPRGRAASARAARARRPAEARASLRCARPAASPFRASASREHRACAPRVAARACSPRRQALPPASYSGRQARAAGGRGQRAGVAAAPSGGRGEALPGGGGGAPPSGRPGGPSGRTLGRRGWTDYGEALAPLCCPEPQTLLLWRPPPPRSAALQPRPRVGSTDVRTRCVPAPARVLSRPTKRVSRTPLQIGKQAQGFVQGHHS